ncbi:MAG: DNA-binding beta-propeller fold protein YncE, partial [Planctomycetota bacterium]
MATARTQVIGLGCVFLGTLAAVSATSPASVPGGGDTAPYDSVDNIEGSFLNFNLSPVRPILAHPSGTGFFALNTHASTIERFDDTGTAPVEVWHMPWGPVAMQLWNDPVSTEDQLLVTCRGSHVLARVDAQTGEIISLLTLPSEPADIVIKHDTNQAFIACSAKDIVVQIDLLNDLMIEYSPGSHSEFNVKNPTFLAISTSGKIMVPSMHSGNNSTASRVFQRRAGEVIDLEDPDYAVAGLPDNDLFRIDPVAQAVVPIGRRIGTTLFGIGVNPATTRTWVLNTDAKNKGPDRQSEQEVRGDIVANRLSIIRPNVTTPAPEPDFYIDLDDTDALTEGTQFDPAQSVGQPFGLDFRSNGNGFIVGLLTDNLVELDQDGVRLGQWDLPEGAIPRAVRVNETAGVVWVYCWGTNEILEYRLSDMQLLRTCELSDDPTPRAIAKGREIFYDAGRSEHGNASCASCHIDGRSDMLAWNLQDKNFDDKGPLLTQTMSGIERMGPFHWRGERSDLEAFNIAFVGLMGANVLKDRDAVNFEAYVLSLVNPANPWAHRERLLDDSSVPYGIDPSAQATLGQQSYQTFPISGADLCTSCHQLPLGTNHDIFSGEPTEVISRRVFNKVPAFNETFRRITSVVSVETLLEPGNPGAGTLIEDRGYLGVGATHSG